MKLEDELKMSTIQNPFHRVTLNVIFTGAWMSEKMNSLLKPFGISEQQYNILRILRGQKGASLNLQDISCRMVHKMSNTTRLVEKLRLKDYVERNVCEDNRRKVQISITKNGLQFVEKISAEIEIHTSNTAKKITKEEAKTLAMLLDKIRE